MKVKKILGKSQPNFQHCVKKIEAQAKNDFPIKNVYLEIVKCQMVGKQLKRHDFGTIILIFKFLKLSET